MKRKILLSFDVEEFDMPLEYGQQVPVTQQMQTGFAGLEAVMNVIERTGIPVTLFTTANFADHYTQTIQQLATKHEIASHTYYHTDFETAHLQQSRERLETISGTPVTGLRMPRMRKVAMQDVIAAGYTYDSSVNPTFLPGRYNNLHLPRTVYKQENMVRLPASVSPWLRLPLFWLSFKNFPYRFYLQLAKQTLKKDGYLCLYYHPWEFVNLDDYRIPGYTKKLAGPPLLKRLETLITDLKQLGEFERSDVFLADYPSKLL